jgi:hypothetical protein
MAYDHSLVAVNRRPGDKRLALYDISDIEQLHWDYTAGGEGRAGRQPQLYAYVWCDAAVDGSPSHSGVHGGPCPHRIAVHVPAKHNPELIDYLRSLADAKPRSRHGYSPLFHNNARTPTR